MQTKRFWYYILYVGHLRKLTSYKWNRRWWTQRFDYIAVLQRAGLLWSLIRTAVKFAANLSIVRHTSSSRPWLWFFSHSWPIKRSQLRLLLLPPLTCNCSVKLCFAPCYNQKRKVHGSFCFVLQSRSREVWRSNWILRDWFAPDSKPNVMHMILFIFWLMKISH
jgi:hypothetical protein